MQPWSSALSACSGAWDTLWLMKREGQGEGGVRTANWRGENGDVDVKVWDNVSHSSWKICVCLRKGEREGENANFPHALDTTSCKVRACSVVQTLSVENSIKPVLATAALSSIQPFKTFIESYLCHSGPNYMWWEDLQSLSCTRTSDIFYRWVLL